MGILRVTLNVRVFMQCLGSRRTHPFKLLLHDFSGNGLNTPCVSERHLALTMAVCLATVEHVVVSPGDGDGAATNADPEHLRSAAARLWNDDTTQIQIPFQSSTRKAKSVGRFHNMIPHKRYLVLYRHELRLCKRHGNDNDNIK